jgi:hypothetical protein
MRWVQKLDTVFRVRRTDRPDQGFLGPYARIGDARAARTVEANRHSGRGNFRSGPSFPTASGRRSSWLSTRSAARGSTTTAS